MLPTYQSVAQELAKHVLPNGNPNWDVVRRAKLAAMEAHTGRPVLVYAVDFLNTAKAKMVGSEQIQIDLADKHGFAEITNQIDGPKVDVVLHSPGGSPNAAESIIALLRNKFTDVRFIVPNIAKSAATMMTMSGNEVLMDANAELGPVDPQLVFRKGDGSIIQSPAQAIVDQFDEAQALIGKDPTKLPAWLPILQQYGPSLYKEARNAIKLSGELVEEWVRNYMLAGQTDGPTKAKNIARFLSNHNEFYSHGRRVGRKPLQDKGANIKNLEDDATLHALVLDVYFAVVHTFTGATYKMFDNSRGQGLFEAIQQQIQIPAQLLPGRQLRPGPPAPRPPQPPGQSA